MPRGYNALHRDRLRGSAETRRPELAHGGPAKRPYQQLAVRCLATMQETLALGEPEPDRGRISVGNDVVPLAEKKRRARQD